MKKISLPGFVLLLLFTGFLSDKVYATETDDLEVTIELITPDAARDEKVMESIQLPIAARQALDRTRAGASERDLESLRENVAEGQQQQRRERLETLQNESGREIDLNRR